LLFLQSTVFSTWLTKEISAASNIKNRSNRQNVQRLLTILNQKFSSINLNTSYQSGIFCYVGINEFDEEIVEFIEPDIKLDLFYYSCSNKFETSLISKYIGNKFEGTIIFANGDDCLGYQFISGEFVKIFGLNGNLVKRHNKGGYSANRFARIAEESRHLYVVRISDRLRELVTKNNWIFGLPRK
jgi:peptide chain release factor subunit 1